ncbi:hypothetical protein [Flavobacterium beibuense]|uniref:Uncharacterized protein n=1 Tax=Flavobacterium beibuense TaxID=657326 RepID=A0A444W8G2_9FLAO|nr:hypothetical protein [Flavobacterium beibuense]RYJ42169.1 hypothetical protein NU09_2573 [Flavobacterium beibuense]
MKIKPLLLVLFITVLSINSYAQELINCTPEKSFWVIKNGSKTYALTLADSKATVKETQLIYNNIAINYEFIDIDSNGINDTETNMLINYMVKISSQHRIPNTTVETKIQNKDGKHLLRIVTPSEKARLIVATTINGKLLSLTTNRPEPGDLANVEDVLEKIILSGSEIDSTDNLCNK